MGLFGRREHFWGALVDAVGGGGGGGIPSNPATDFLGWSDKEEEPSGPAPDNRPTCDSYKRYGMNETALRGFDTKPDCQGTNPLSTWLAQERTKFCQNITNFTKNPGGDGGTCIERNTGQELARTYCGGTDKIKSSQACTRVYLGDESYALLAIKYCGTETGIADSWCSCHNVSQTTVCDTNSNAAGCPEKALTFDVLVAKTPEAFKSEWSGREACYGLVCQGDKYIPTNANQNCNSPVQICGYTINAENLTNSTVDAKCNMGGRDYDEEGNVINPGNPAANLVADLPTGIAKYIPLSFDDITGEDTDKKIGAGGAVSFSCMSCACIILLLLVVSSSGSGGSRLRR
jgi:hypothetical protein